MFVVPTISFWLLYGFVVVRHSRQEPLWLGVTTHPTTGRIAGHRDRRHGAHRGGSLAAVNRMLLDEICYRTTRTQQAVRRCSWWSSGEANWRRPHPAASRPSIFEANPRPHHEPAARRCSEGWLPPLQGRPETRRLQGGELEIPSRGYCYPLDPL
jgi:hypothetical protein